MDTAYIGTQKFLASERCEFVQLSESFLRLIEYDSEELWERFNNSFFALIYPDDRERVKSELRRQLTGSSYYAINYRVISRSGLVIWLHDQGRTAVEDGVKYFYSEISDISRYYSQDAYYEGILNAMCSPVVIIDEQLRIIFLNSVAEKSLGFVLSQCKGKPCSIFRTPYCNTDKCSIKCFERGDTGMVRFENNGRINQISISRLYGAGGEKLGYINVLTDITEQLDAERRLRLNEERYHIVLGQTNNYVWEYDLATRTVYQSDRQTVVTRELFGFGSVMPDMPESIITAGLVDPDSVGSLREMSDDIHAGLPETSRLIRQNGLDGSIHWMQITCTTLYDAAGAPYRAVCVAQDVTTEKDLEQRYLEEKQYRTSMASHAMAVYELNLTQNTLQRLEAGEPLPGFREDAPTYSDLVESVVAACIAPEHRASVRASISPDSLLAAFAQGRREVSCEYRRLDNDDRMVWVRTTVNLIRSTSSGEVRGFMTIKNIHCQKEQELDLRRRVEYDPLTGMRNRTAALTMIEGMLRTPKKESQPFSALFLLDIDDFKQINDTYGHRYGDAVLAEFGKRLAGFLRRGDVIGRTGGDAFIILMRDLSDVTCAIEQAELICREMQTTYSADGRCCTLSCSLGVAFAPTHGEELNHLYAKADRALCRAKKLGKNRFVVYDDSLAQTDNQ